MAIGKAQESTVIVAVRVHARASRSEIQEVRDGRLQVRTTAPPVDGRANKEVIRQLAEEFGVSPSRVSLKSGATGRNKVFLITNPAVLPPWFGQLKRNP